MLTDEQLNGLLKLIIKYADRVFTDMSEEDINKLCVKLREYYHVAHAGAEAGAAQVRQVRDYRPVTPHAADPDH